MWSSSAGEGVSMMVTVVGAIDVVAAAAAVSAVVLSATATVAVAVVLVALIVTVAVVAVALGGRGRRNTCTTFDSSTPTSPNNWAFCGKNKGLKTKK